MKTPWSLSRREAEGFYAEHSARLHARCRAAYDQRDFGLVLREVMAVADSVNGLIAERAPWVLAKDESKRAELHAICSLALSLFRLLAAWLKPIVPALAQASEDFLRARISAFEDVAEPLPAGHAINPFSALATRVDPKHIEAMVEASKDTLAAAPEKQPAKPAKAAPSAPQPPAPSPAPASAAPGTSPETITIDQFTAIINPPEAGILAIGGIESKPVVVGGEIQVRRRMRVTMSCDHRVIDGAAGAKFLQTLRRLIENPLLLVY